MITQGSIIIFSQNNIIIRTKKKKGLEERIFPVNREPLLKNTIPLERDG
jgi:hypothetical protein